MSIDDGPGKKLDSFFFFGFRYKLTWPTQKSQPNCNNNNKRFQKPKQKSKHCKLPKNIHSKAKREISSYENTDMNHNSEPEKNDVFCVLLDPRMVIMIVIFFKMMVVV